MEGEQKLEQKKFQSGEGTVTIPLEDYINTKDLLETLLKTTDTHKEFIVKFRKSLVQLLMKAKDAGINMDPLFDYYADLKFDPIDGVEVVPSKDELDGSQKWIVVLTKKTVKDEGISLNND